MNADIAAKLRAPFPAEAIGKRPQPTCRACSDAQSRVCGSHRKERCGDCGQFMTTAHVHLDYVGHADVTDRLLAADPEWSWEPVADAAALGLPVVEGGMWIRLTVAGTTKLGFGDAGGKRGPNAVKEMIGDALRNAAMRFGVALDLWMKGDRAAARNETEGEPEQSEADKIRDEIRRLAEFHGWNLTTIAQGYAKEYPGRQLKTETAPEPMTLFLQNLKADAACEAEKAGVA